jgi:hypothetical protein
VTVILHALLLEIPEKLETARLTITALADACMHARTF